MSPGHKSITSVMRAEHLYDQSLLTRDDKLCQPTPDKWKNRAAINFTNYHSCYLSFSTK